MKFHTIITALIATMAMSCDDLDTAELRERVENLEQQNAQLMAIIDGADGLSAQLKQCNDKLRSSEVQLTWCYVGWDDDALQLDACNDALAECTARLNRCNKQ